MAKFLTELDLHCKPTNEKVWILDSTLVYYSDLLGEIYVPAGFETDLASVPRLPLVYVMWGNRAHREAVVHDYLYRVNSNPVVTRAQADAVFKEAMKATGKPAKIWLPMWLGVRIGSMPYFHKKRVEDVL